MKPAPFEYVRIDHPDELSALLAEHGPEAAVLAGGQSLIPILNLRLRRPRVLLDLSRCRALHDLTSTSGGLQIGAAVTQATVLSWPRLAHQVPLLALSLPHVGNPQIRSRGTLCGSLAHAHPQAELPLCLAALDGEIVLRSQRGERRIAAADFFIAAQKTACRPDEYIARAHIPCQSSDAGSAFLEVAVRATGQAQVACAAIAGPRHLRLAVLAGQATPQVHDYPVLPEADLRDQLDIIARSLVLSCASSEDDAYRRQVVVSLGLHALRQAQRARDRRAAVDAQIVEHRR